MTPTFWVLTGLSGLWALRLLSPPNVQREMKATVQLFGYAEAQKNFMSELKEAPSRYWLATFTIIAFIIVLGLGIVNPAMATEQDVWTLRFSKWLGSLMVMVVFSYLICRSDFHMNKPVRAWLNAVALLDGSHDGSALPQRLVYVSLSELMGSTPTNLRDG